MPIGFYNDIRDVMPQSGRILGLDIGTKTIGLALFDPMTTMITPLSTLKRSKFSCDILALKDVIRTYEITGYAAGLPLNDDGSENKACQRIRDFILEFSNRADICGKAPWIAYVDEGLSTHTVEHFVDTSLDISRQKAKAKGITDSLAAVEILRALA